MDLQIEKYTLPEIKHNLAILRADVKAIADKFAGAQYDESQMKIAKADRADLNRLKKQIDDKRKEVKSIWQQPLLKFEAEVKDIVSLIDAPAALIDGQVKEYEARLEKEREDALRRHFDAFNTLGSIIKFEKVIEGEKWLNLSMREAKALAELADKMEKINRDVASLETIIEPEYRTACLAEYGETLDTNGAIVKQVKLKAAKAEQEKILGAAVEEPKPAAAVEEKPAPVEEDIFAPEQAAVSTRRYAITATNAGFNALHRYAAENQIKLREVF